MVENSAQKAGGKNWLLCFIRLLYPRQATATTKLSAFKIQTDRLVCSRRGGSNFGSTPCVPCVVLSVCSYGTTVNSRVEHERTAWDRGTQDATNRLRMSNCYWYLRRKAERRSSLFLYTRRTIQYYSCCSFVPVRYLGRAPRSFHSQDACIMCKSPVCGMPLPPRPRANESYQPRMISLL